MVAIEMKKTSTLDMLTLQVLIMSKMQYIIVLFCNPRLIFHKFTSFSIMRGKSAVDQSHRQEIIIIVGLWTFRSTYDLFA